MWKTIIGGIILGIVGIISLILWYKKIDPNTTWIYGVYIGIILIFWLFVSINLEQL